MKTLLITLALMMQAPADSLPDLSRPWTLQDCMDWALSHNLTIASQNIAREKSAVDKNTAEWSWVPDLNGSVSENWSFGRGIGGNNTYERGNSASTGFSLSSSMPLFDGLATPRRIQLARLNLEAATQDLEKARDDIRMAVAKAYVQVLYNYEIEDVARHQLGIDSLQVARLQGMFDNGKASAADLAQHIPTYEDVLTADKGAITEASYVTRGEKSCIYVEVRQGETDAVDRYWIETATGLLAFCETAEGDKTVYSMEETAYSAPLEETAVFTLPDGTMPSSIQEEGGG